MWPPPIPERVTQLGDQDAEMEDQETIMPSRFDVDGEAWKLLHKKATDNTLSSAELHKVVLKLCQDREKVMQMKSTGLND